ncbi:hypothetical protein LCGC14_1549190 [marine sediment metagenome]|uniref:SMP-30/Gluconolactonase/LRE-like region domain-containing protein n=1 Tax=marine sediment metagenome TaxID=412755 RepID=A0A0F9JBR3_9ZZZZ
MYPKAQLVMIRTDGSVPDAPRGPIITDETRGKTPAGAGPENVKYGGNRTGSLAMSPDEKTIYISEVNAGGWSGKPTHIVYRCAWGDKYARAFLGELNVPGKGAKGLSDPRGICTGADGKIYVADHGNDRIAVFKPDGSFLGELPVDRPHRVEVAPDGALYVLGGRKHATELSKFKSWDAPQPIARAELPEVRNKNFVGSLALDASAEPRIVWVGASWNSAYTLLRIEEADGKFAKPVDVVGRPKGPTRSLGPVFDVSVNKIDGTLMIRSVPGGWREQFFLLPDAVRADVLTPAGQLRRWTRFSGSFGMDDLPRAGTRRHRRSAREHLSADAEQGPVQRQVPRRRADRSLQVLARRADAEGQADRHRLPAGGLAARGLPGQHLPDGRAEAGQGAAAAGAGQRAGRR